MKSLKPVTVYAPTFVNNVPPIKPTVTPTCCGVK